MNRKQPLSIIIVCTLGFLGGVLALPMVFFAERDDNIYLAFSAIVGITCMLGLWNMKKWGVYGYMTMASINQIVLWSEGRWSPLSLLIPGIVIFIGLSHLEEMN